MQAYRREPRWTPCDKGREVDPFILSGIDVVMFDQLHDREAFLEHVVPYQAFPQYHWTTAGFLDWIE
jgi:hypothetical protein